MKHPFNKIPDKIHYACGKVIIDGWLNVDNFDPFSYPDGRIDGGIAKKIYKMDLKQKHPFKDNHFIFGFAEDFLEHLDQAESLIFLSECFRTFKMDGVLRLSFPELGNVLKRHFTIPSYKGAEKGRIEAYQTWNHKHFYSFENLKLVSRHIGFREIKRVRFGESEFNELKNIDTRDDQQDFNLIVEIIR